MRYLTQYITARRRQPVGGRIRWIYRIDVGGAVEETVHNDIMEARQLAFQRIVVLLEAQGQPIEYNTIARLASIHPTGFQRPQSDPTPPAAA